LAVVQEHFNPGTKMTYWGVLDPALANDIYISDGFEDYFEHHADRERNGLYPTVKVRKLMWALRIRPLRKEFWEEDF
jgi:hypothetical protein